MEIKLKWKLIEMEMRIFTTSLKQYRKKNDEEIE